MAFVVATFWPDVTELPVLGGMMTDSFPGAGCDPPAAAATVTLTLRHPLPLHTAATTSYVAVAFTGHQSVNSAAPKNSRRPSAPEIYASRHPPLILLRATTHSQYLIHTIRTISTTIITTTTTTISPLATGKHHSIPSDIFQRTNSLWRAAIALEAGSDGSEEETQAL